MGLYQRKHAGDNPVAAYLMKEQPLVPLQPGLQASLWWWIHWVCRAGASLAVL